MALLSQSASTVFLESISEEEDDAQVDDTFLLNPISFSTISQPHLISGPFSYRKWTKTQKKKERAVWYAAVARSSKWPPSS